MSNLVDSWKDNRADLDWKMRFELCGRRAHMAERVALGHARVRVAQQVLD